MSLPRPSPSGEGRSLVRDKGKLQAGCSLRPGEAGLTGPGSHPHLHHHGHLLFLSHLSAVAPPWSPSLLSHPCPECSPHQVSRTPALSCHALYAEMKTQCVSFFRDFLSFRLVSQDWGRCRQTIQDGQPTLRYSESRLYSDKR